MEKESKTIFNMTVSGPSSRSFPLGAEFFSVLDGLLFRTKRTFFYK